MLGALADFARENQVIVFTHHRHIADVAVRYVPQDMLALVPLLVQSTLKNGESGGCPLGSEPNSIREPRASRQPDCSSEAAGLSSYRRGAGESVSTRKVSASPELFGPR